MVYAAWGVDVDPVAGGARRKAGHGRTGSGREQP